MERTNEQTLYDILGVPITATLAEIKKAYRQRCMEYHPDVNPNANNASCHEMMCKINEAYRTLRNKESRYDYDEMLKQRGLYYDSKSSVSVEEHNNRQESEKRSKTSSNTTSHVYENAYDHYYDCDIDDEEENEFICWMEDFADYYTTYVRMYYRKNGYVKNIDELLDKLDFLFYENIELEKESSRKVHSYSRVR